MNRGEIRAEILDRLDRSDSQTTANINTWIDRIVRDIEKLYPFSYLEKSQTAVLTAADNTYTLPDDLIIHHPFELLLKSIAGPPYSYSALVKVGERTFDMWFGSPDDTGEGPTLYLLRGGSGGLNFQVYPVQETNRTVKLGSGFYYTGDFAGDSSENYLTDKYPDCIIESVAAKSFLHYGESSKAQTSMALAQAYINGDASQGIVGVIQSEKKAQWNGRAIRVRTWDDYPLGIARKKRMFP